MRLQRGTRAWVRRGGKSSHDGKMQGFQKSALKMGISACILIGRRDGIAQSRGGSMVEGTGWQRPGAGDAASRAGPHARGRHPWSTARRAAGVWVKPSSHRRPGIGQHVAGYTATAVSQGAVTMPHAPRGFTPQLPVFSRPRDRASRGRPLPSCLCPDFWHFAVFLPIPRSPPAPWSCPLNTAPGQGPTLRASLSLH